ncbi:PTS sugar transporter subunit IIA [Anaerorhabdus sp.]|uniref:PTS sugar transporter subunit IIA n=1 Tax=Anaerorhabdus sp. TaxID=1872524 RepID=UPI002FC95C9A
MRRIILASHGKLAEGMKDAAKLITGDLAETIETYCLMPGSAPLDYATQLQEEITNNQDVEFVIVTDLYGASVCSAMYPLTFYPNVKLFTGLSLPIVLNLLLSYTEQLNPSSIEEILQESKEGIKFIVAQSNAEQVENDF